MDQKDDVPGALKFDPERNSWRACEGAEVVEALADFPITLEEVRRTATAGGTVLHTPAGRYKVVPVV